MKNIHVDIDVSIKIFNDIVKENENIRERDKSTKDSLKHDQTIDFILISEGTNDLPEINSIDDIPEKFVLTYDKFINNNMTVDNLGLINSDDIVLKSSYCNILFSYPVNYNEPIIFSIGADDKKIGFKRKELALKAMQKYHLLYYLYKNYDVEKGEIVLDEKKVTIFEPNQCDEEYTQNGLLNLIYDKEKDHWIFNTYKFV